MLGADCRGPCPRPVQSGGLGEFHTKEEVIRFLETFQIPQSSTKQSNEVVTLAKEQVERIASFHLSVVKPLRGRYTRWKQANPTNATENPESFVPLSKKTSVLFLLPLSIVLHSFLEAASEQTPTTGPAFTLSTF